MEKVKKTDPCWLITREDEGEKMVLGICGPVLPIVYVFSTEDLANKYISENNLGVVCAPSQESWKDFVDKFRNKYEWAVLDATKGSTGGVSVEIEY